MMFFAQCADVVVPPATEMAMRYFESGNILWVVEQLWLLIVPLLFLVKGFSWKLARFSERWGKNWFFSLAIYLLFFVALYQLLNLPLEFYAGYLRQHTYGLSSQSLDRWFFAYGKQTLVAICYAVAFVWIFYLLLKKSPHRWWIYSALVATGLFIFSLFIQPVWIDPLFNKFEPMKDKRLESVILDLGRRAGIENERVFQVDKSQDTPALNAYVVGWGDTTRIVLWDTTLKRMPEDELLFVMGHEMGHYVLHHIPWLILFFGGLSFVISYLIFKCATWANRRELADISSFPLLLFLLNLFLFLFLPVSNYFSRYQEHEADRFGLEITQDNEAAGNAFLILQQSNLVNPRPGPIFKFFRSTHPPLGERVDFTNSYCPWKKGEPLKYGSEFHSD